MATNLTTTATLNNTDENTKHSTANLAVTTSGDHVDSGRISVGTTEETYTISTDIGNVGWCYFKNHGPTNFVEIGDATTDYLLRLKVNEACLVRLKPTTATLYLKADTAAVDLTYVIYED